MLSVYGRVNWGSDSHRGWLVGLGGAISGGNWHSVGGGSDWGWHIRVLGVGGPELLLD